MTHQLLAHSSRLPACLQYMEDDGVTPSIITYSTLFKVRPTDPSSHTPSPSPPACHAPHLPGPSAL